MSITSKTIRYLAGALALSCASLAAAQTIIDVNPDRPDGQNFAPITQLVLNDTLNNNQVVQNAEIAGTGIAFSRNTPFNLESVTVDDGGPVELGFTTIVNTIVLQGFGIDGQTPSNGGVSVFSADGSEVVLAPNAAARAAWREAAARGLESDDLLNYILYDGGPSPLPPGSTPDWDVVYSYALEPQNYLMVMERDGNTFFEVLPLDAAGNPIPGANLLRFGDCDGAPNGGCGGSLQVYDWNVGLAHSTYQSGQPMALSVAPITKFFEGTSVPLADQLVFGLRVDNDGGADVKFFGLSNEPIIFNEPLPGVSGNFVWFDEDEDGIQDPLEPGINGVTVRLLDGLGNPVNDIFGNPLIAVTQNDENGNAGWYRFVGLPAGDYQIEFELPSGFIFTGQDSDAAGVSGPDNSDASPVDGRTNVITLPVQGENLALDAGLLPPEFGSLPVASYPTLLADDGPRHQLSAGDAFLGAIFPDRELDASAGGDNSTGTADEDGILLLENWVSGNPAPQEAFFRVTIGEPGFLSLYLDDDATNPGALQRATLDAVITGPGAVSVPAGTGNFGDLFFPVAGDYTLRVILPANVGEEIATRWRITSGAGEGGDSATGFAASGEVEDYIFDSGGGVPVVLAWISSASAASGLTVEWSTASEVANLGFRLIASDGLTPLHEGLIASEVIDSTDPSFYAVSLASPGRSFFIEDIDREGQVVRRGPYQVGESYGRKPVPQRIDWGGIRQAQAALSSVNDWVAGRGQAVHLMTSSEGIYRVHHSDLIANGIDLRGQSVNAMALTLRGAPIPFHTSAGSRFGETDWLEFYAEAGTSLYTADNVYQLWVDRAEMHRKVALEQTSLIQAPAQNAHVDSVVVGARKRYSFTAPIADPWFDLHMVVTTSAKSWDYRFEVDQLRASEDSSQLQLVAWGVTRYDEVAQDHHLVAAINGVPVADVWFDGGELVDLVLDFDSSLLTDGENIRLSRCRLDTGVAAEAVAFREAIISYPRRLVLRAGELNFTASGQRIELQGAAPVSPVVYRVLGDQVTRIVPRSGAAVSTLFQSRFERDDRSGMPVSLVIAGTLEDADYLVRNEASLPVPSIVAGQIPSDFRARASDYLMISHPGFIDALAPLVDFHEKQGRTVDVIDVRDIFSIYSDGFPEASAIQAFLREANERSAFQFVLLVGGDTYDYKGYLNSGSMSFVPTIYASASDLVRHLPADALLVDLDGDDRPDRAIGRLPVRTVAELQTVIDKTLTYHARDYRRRAALAADESDGGQSFTLQSESLASALSSWTLERSYLDQMPLEQARQSIIDAFDAGQSLVTFAGHSAPSVWTFKGLFTAQDVEALAPLDRPSVVAQWGCWNTYHVSPNYNTMGHRLMLTEGRGAAAVMGSATFTETWSSAAMSDALGPYFQNAQLGIGEMLLEAKRELDPITARDVILGWTLLGDPALKVAD